MVDNKTIFHHVDIAHPGEKVCKNWKHRCLHGAVVKRVRNVMERCYNNWCDTTTGVTSVFAFSHMRVEHTWLSYIWVICRVSSEGLYGMPFMWSKCGYKMFFPFEEECLSRPSMLLWCTTPIPKKLCGLQWTTKEYVYTNKSFATNFLTRVEEWEEWLCTKI